MKTFIAYLIATTLLMTVFFAILYRLVKLEYSDLLIAALIGVFAGILVELVNKTRKRTLKNIEA